jgi:hypothetical protein
MARSHRLFANAKLGKRASWLQKHSHLSSSSRSVTAHNSPLIAAAQLTSSKYHIRPFHSSEAALTQTRIKPQRYVICMAYMSTYLFLFPFGFHNCRHCRQVRNQTWSSTCPRSTAEDTRPCVILLPPFIAEVLKIQAWFCDFKGR